MTLIDKTAPGQGEALALELELPHAPQKIWRALTDPELLTEWLLPAFDFKPEPGTAFHFQAPVMPGWDGVVSCRILESAAPTRLSYAWVVGEMVLDTVVTFTLTPTPSGTRLLLVQSGFKPEQKQAFGGARYGWKMMVGKLVELLARAP